MRNKKTYISKNQLNRYGFTIDRTSKTDLKASSFILGFGTIDLFNYDYYTTRPDTTLMININGVRVFEKPVTNTIRFKQVMKQFDICPVIEFKRYCIQCLKPCNPNEFIKPTRKIKIERLKYNTI